MSEVHARRRAELLARLPSGAVAVVAGYRLARRNSDVEHPFRQASDVLFLTGFGEPDAWVVVGKERPTEFAMFVRPRDPERETWTGRRLGVDGAVKTLGANAAWPVEELDARLPELLDGASEVHYSIGDDEAVDRAVTRAIGRLRAGERRGQRAPTRLVDIRTSLHEVRLRKDAEALAALRRAVDVTAEAHVAAMQQARDGVGEWQIEALIDGTFRRAGGRPGYGTIVGGGANATILHYVDNSAALHKGELLLVDAGGEIDGFTADVTRTYPVGARFGAAQRRVYEHVLAVEKACIARVRPGESIDEIHRLAVEMLTAAMVSLELLHGAVDELVAKEAYRRFYMHRTSHWLGLDVHDAGMYYVDGKSRPLAAGMVLTVEPGLYVAADATDVPPELRGIGVRIEDDVLVTPDGHEVLTAKIPKEVEELEKLTGR